jgi:hypothetical protein
MLIAIRIVAALLLLTLLALHRAARWTEHAVAWAAVLQEAMDEFSEPTDDPPDATDISERRQPAAANTADEAHPPAQPMAPGGSGIPAVLEGSDTHARLVALIARVQAADLSVPLPDGMTLDLSVTALDNYALEIEESELPLPPRM